MENTENTRFNLSRWALQHQALTRYLMVVLFLGGVLALFQLGQDEDPPFTFRASVIRAYWPGASALQMAQQVADPIEKVLQEVDYIEKIHTYTKPGEMLITFLVRGEASPSSVPELWKLMRNKIGDIAHTLPPGVQGPFINDQFGDVYGSIYALSAEGFSYAELRDYADAIRQQLLQVPSVAKVELLGKQDEKIYIEFSQTKLAQLGVDLDSIIQQIGAQNDIHASGVLRSPSDDVPIRLSGQFQNAKALEALVLHGKGEQGGLNFRLGDIATVRRAYEDPPIAKMRFQGKEVIGLGISMAKGGDVVALGKHLREQVALIRSQLPVGVEIEQVQDQPTAVTASIHEFLQVLAEAVIVVLAVSFVSLGLHSKPLRIDIRPGLVVALTIPLVLSVTFLFMHIFGIGLHKISLGALIVALGLLVDDAIIAVEMMVRKLEEGYDKLSAASFAYSSTAMPMLTGTLITAAGFLPVGLAKSTVGEYTFAIFAVTAIALILSWFAAVYFVPYLGFLLLNVKSKVGSGEHHELFDTPFYSRFRQLVRACVVYRKTVIAITVMMFALGIVGFRFVQVQFFPDSSRPEIIVDMWLPEGSGYAHAETQARRLEAMLLKDKDIATVTTFVGTGAPRFYLPLDQLLPQTNIVELVVIPADIHQRDELRKRIEQIFKHDFPDVRGRVKLLPNGPPVAWPVQFRVTGPDPEEVRRYADQVARVMRSNPNTVDVNDNWNEPIKVMRLDIDQGKARALGVTNVAIARTTQTVLTGAPVAKFRDGNRFIDIVMRADKRERDELADLANVLVPTESGEAVPLAQLATIGFAWEPGVIWRESGDYGITVQSEVKDGVQGPTLTSQIDPLLNPIRRTMPAGYQILVAGAQEESAKGSGAIVAQLPLTVFIIFTLLMLQLQSFSRAVMVFLTGPLGLIGAVGTLLALNAPMGFVAQLGITALIGMIIRNSVILVDQIESDIRAGHAPGQAIVEAAVRRFRPIMLTAAAAVLAMVPLSRSVFWGPMAVAIMGGLIVATALTLLFLPALYAAWFRVKAPAYA